MGIEDRLYTFPWIKFEGFDQVLNNFLASYFAGALLIPKDRLVKELKKFFQKETWNESSFLSLMKKFTSSPETFYQRLTNILPKHFHFKNLFFLRFSHKTGSDTFRLSKELHITQQQAPHATELQEHYCRRWVSLRTLTTLEATEEQHHVFDAQISDYPQSNNQYFVFSSATSDPFKKDINRSVSLGMLVSPNLKKHIRFLNDPSIITKKVGVTCETCAIKDCTERANEAYKLDKKERHKEIERKVEEIIENF